MGNTQVTQETKHTQHWLPGGLKYNINGRKNDKSRLSFKGWVGVYWYLSWLCRKLSVRDTLVAC